MSSSPQLLIFDVNETLLDTKAVQTAINKEIGNPEAAGKWFQSLLHYSLVETVSGDFADFSQIADACLEMTAENYDKALSAEKREIILSEFKKLSSHEEVFEGLQRLKNAGFIIVALSNGTLETVNEQLKFAGISPLFDRIFSIQSVGKFKPHPSTYAYVLDKMEISADKALMIAAHPWDLLGAARAGLQTAFIKRVGKSNYPLSSKNDFVAEDLMELSNQLIH
ncbi:haloacid dehalogenase type II [uncultured Cyclobacterium sp.]|uniref:haloacid dehalogenase type II n=1 Tax=uncultured Cyclobacterium sp. TaxID=453820 RepID=UPI0030EB3328|tara:strand:- start:237 stop:908 length:672 start_codon:yes stop_codon:yes gene_type:complete